MRGIIAAVEGSAMARGASVDPVPPSANQWQPIVLGDKRALKPDELLAVHSSEPFRHAPVEVIHAPAVRLFTPVRALPQRPLPHPAPSPSSSSASTAKVADVFPTQPYSKIVRGYAMVHPEQVRPCPCPGPSFRPLCSGPSVQPGPFL